MTPALWNCIFYSLKKESLLTNLWVNALSLRNNYNPRLALKNTKYIKQNKKGR